MIGQRFQVVSRERVTTTLIATILFLFFVIPGVLLAQNDILILPDENSNPQTNEGQADIYLPDEEKAEPIRSGFSIFYETWTNFQTALERGDGESANQSLAQLIQLKNRNAIK